MSVPDWIRTCDVRFRRWGSIDRFYTDSQSL